MNRSRLKHGLRLGDFKEQVHTDGRLEENTRDAVYKHAGVHVTV